MYVIIIMYYVYTGYRDHFYTKYNSCFKTNQFIGVLKLVQVEINLQLVKLKLNSSW